MDQSGKGESIIANGLLAEPGWLSGHFDSAEILLDIFHTLLA